MLRLETVTLINEMIYLFESVNLSVYIKSEECKLCLCGL